ncbi:protein of unknown function DUF59 [Macleaya cordata]|uniref:MIP18 family-like domain-containing protein n=1 Tax=Macleaya cordata TaxID=56857 RepID=A0A200PX92_MACCD|nr:protein of unknown function DUF59 [Macleaya cordata]
MKETTNATTSGTYFVFDIFTWKMVSQLINANPIVYKRKESRKCDPIAPADVDEYAVKPIDQRELNFHHNHIFISLTILNHIRDIKDPEHPYSLEELNVISEDAVEVDDKHSRVRVTFTPTNLYCSFAQRIGLYIRVKLMLSLPSCYKVDIKVAPGTLATEAAVNKLLNDKERIAALLESPQVMDKIVKYLAPTDFCANDVQEPSSFKA